MIRYAFNVTRTHVRLFHLSTTRRISTPPFLDNQARASQIIEQAQSAVPSVYKAVKEKALDDKAVRRDQIISLFRYSISKEKEVEKDSPHHLPWTSVAVQKEQTKAGEQVEITVWPHLWWVFRCFKMKKRMLIID